jgi:formylglycine-generating enzyme required for sulfatase activity
MALKMQIKPTMKTTPLKFCLFLILVGVSLSASAQKLKSEVGKFVLIEPSESKTADSLSPNYAYYIFETEVTNLDYAEFLSYLKINQPESYALAKCDSSAWQEVTTSLAELYEQNYHVHQTWRSYPVVNISQQAAEMYCTWLGERLKEGFLKKADFDFEVRLPTHAEWRFAAKGGFRMFSYAWAGYTLYDEEGKARCCFNKLSAHNIFTNPKTGAFEVRERNDGLFGNLMSVKPVGKFEENGNGLYDVCGNVAEMLSDKALAAGGHWLSPGGDVQIESTIPYNGEPKCVVGFRPVLIVR